MTFRSRFFAAFVLFMFIAADGAWATVQGAREFIDKLGGEAVSIMKSNESQGEKEDKLKGLFRRGLDFGTIGRFVLGRHWQEATPEQRQEFQRIFADVLVQRYSSIWAAESIEGFQISSAKDLGGQDALVQTEVNRGPAPQLNFGWRVREKGGEYKIVDVVVDGVSMIVTQRADFSSAVQRQGIDGLISTLKQMVSQR